MFTSTEKVQELYLAYFQRPADPRGLKFWRDALDSGVTHNPGREMAKSSEFGAAFGGKSHADAVDKLFLNLFGRHADDAGLKLYKGVLESGKATVDSVAIDILKGATGVDRETVENKLAVAELFSATVRIDSAFSMDDLYEIDTKAVQEWIASVKDDASAYAALGRLPDMLQLLDARPPAPR
jgi:hypothetical protein